MKTAGVVTNPSGYPYQWVHGTAYAPRDGYTEHVNIGNPFTARAYHSVYRADGTELVTLLTRVSQSGMQFESIAYPYDFSDHTWYTRDGASRAPYGL